MTTRTLTATALTRALRPTWPNPVRLASKVSDNTVEVTIPDRAADIPNPTDLIAGKLADLTGLTWTCTDRHPWTRADTGSWVRLTFTLPTTGDPVPPPAIDADGLAPVRIGRSATVHIGRPAGPAGHGNPMCTAGRRRARTGGPLTGPTVDQQVNCVVCARDFPAEIAAMNLRRAAEAAAAQARVPGPAEELATTALAAAVGAAEQAHAQYIDAINAGRPGGVEADRSGEANVGVARAELARDIADGTIPAGRVRFYRVDNSGSGVIWTRIGWGRSDALAGETPDQHAARIAEQKARITGQLTSPRRWRVQVWTSPAAGRNPDGEWSRDAVRASDLNARAKDGPIEVRGDDGWHLFAGATACLYSRTLIRTLAAAGERALLVQADDTVDVRPAATAPIDPRCTAPGAGESRVIAGYLIRRYVGWQWQTRKGWETITTARQNTVGRWFISTAESDTEYCEPVDHFATIRPAVDPTDRVSYSTVVGSGCCCHLWPDNASDTIYARYPGPACPAHPAPPSAPRPAPLPAGRAVRVAGGVRVSHDDQRLMAKPVAITRQGRVLRTWLNPADGGQRWYEVLMQHSGEVVARPDFSVVEIPDPGWAEAAGVPVIFEAEVLLDTGGWGHEAAGISFVADCDFDPLIRHARTLAEQYVTRTRHTVRVFLVLARETDRELNPYNSGYVVAEPGTPDSPAAPAA